MFIHHGEIIDYDFFKTKNCTSETCILFLHGWGGDKNSFNSTVELLKWKYNCLKITLPTINPTSLVWDMEDYTACVINILQILNLKNIKIVCHSFGFRIATLLYHKLNRTNKNDKMLHIEKIVVTAGAGPKKFNIFNKVNKNNSICLLKQDKNKFLFENLASNDYKTLSNNNRATFKNIVNFNTINFLKFNVPLLLFWGKSDKETPIWIAKKILKNNQDNAKLFVTNSDHFAYLKENVLFNNLAVKFL